MIALLDSNQCYIALRDPFYANFLFSYAKEQAQKFFQVLLAPSTELLYCGLLTH